MGKFYSGAHFVPFIFYYYCTNLLKSVHGLGFRSKTTISFPVGAEIAPQIYEPKHLGYVGIEAYIYWASIRARPRFFDKAEHQTTNASIGNKCFFTK